MASAPIDLPPGIVKKDSPATIAGRYIDAQWMRFRDGRPEKIGGYVAMFSETLVGFVRGMLAWTTVAGTDLIAAGTATKLYSTADVVQDITPLDPANDTGALTDPFTTVNTSTTVTVHDVDHGRDVGATVIFSGASAVGGITINGAYLVATVVDDDNYTIVHSAPATSGASGGGSVTYEYEINPGLTETASGRGWGAGGWGMGTWGTPRDATDAVTLEARYWFFGKYGSHLLALPSGSTLYEWNEPDNDDRALPVLNAPTARGMFITPERYVMMLGTDTPMTVSWPDQDDITDWTPSDANTANKRTLQNGTFIVAGTALAELVSLVWTNSSLYVFQYTGSDFVYDSRLVSDASGLVAPGAFATAYGTAYWLSKAGFLLYQGGVSPIPNSEDIRDFVLAALNPDRVGKTWCGFNPEKGEIWWGYAALGFDEPNRYAMVTLAGYIWSTGRIARTAMSYHSSPIGKPVMAGTDGIIYSHETGLDADDAAIEAYIETGIVALRGPDQDTEYFRFIPDFQRQVGAVTLDLQMFERPMSQTPIDNGTFTIEEGDEVTDVHLSGRYAQLLLTSNEVGGDLRLGIPALDTEPGGAR